MKKPQCARCHRPLTDPFSIAVGYGPECRGGMSRKGWKFPKPAYKVYHGHVVLMSMKGRVEPPNGNAQEKKLQDEKTALVLRIKARGGTSNEAVEALHDYMHEKDSAVTRLWCEAFVWKTWKEAGDETE